VPGRHQAYDGKGRCPAPFGLVADERWPASVYVLKTLERLERLRKFDARLPAQSQYRETCGFDRVLIAPISPSTGGFLICAQCPTKS
jgi:hypothetical protein